MKNQQSQTRSWISESIALASIPVIAHTIAFLYEVGYCQFFGIPLSLISIDLTSIFVAGGVLLSVVWPMVFFIHFLSMLWPNTNNPLIRHLLPLTPGLFIFCGYILLFGTDWVEWVMIAIPLITIFVMVSILPLLTQRDKASYTEKLKGQADIDAQFSPPIFEHVSKIDGGRGLFICGLLSILFILSHGAGRASAKKQTEFMILKSSPKITVLRIYGENLICASFDPKAKILQGDFMIIKMGESSKEVLSLKKIGPLSKEEVS